MKKVLPSLFTAAGLALLLAFWVVWYNARLLGPGGWMAALPGLLLAVGVVFALFAAAGGIMGQMGAEAQAAEELRQARAAAEEARERSVLVERIHRAVLALGNQADLAGVVQVVMQHLAETGVRLEGMAVHLLCAEARCFLSVGVGGAPAEPAVHTIPLDAPAARQRLHHWERGETWEWMPDRENPGFGGGAAPPAGVVVELPFAEGTLAVALPGPSSAPSELLAVLVALTPLVSLGYRRTRQRTEQRWPTANPEGPGRTDAG